jgi:hypothetical protein
VPIPERYYAAMVARHEEAERRSRRDRVREWLRVLGEIFLWSSLGLIGLGLALHVLDVERGLVYWWAGAFVWVGGVSTSVITAYLRGVKRGDWR